MACHNPRGFALLRTQRHMALPLEPRGLLAEWDSARGRLTIYGGAKVLFFNRRTLAKQLGLSESAIDIVENDVAYRASTT